MSPVQFFLGYFHKRCPECLEMSLGPLAGTHHTTFILVLANSPTKRASSQIEVRQISLLTLDL